MTAGTGPEHVWAGETGEPGSAYLPPPAGYRPSGTAPYWAPGTHVLWSYRRAHGSGATRPVRVVADDEQALVVWLAPGTLVTVSALPDGRPVRSVPTDRVFREGRSLRTDTWAGLGILKIAPTGVPWSLWRFTSPDGRPAWYVNLEDPHCRDAAGVLTQDHVLDLVVEPRDGAALTDTGLTDTGLTDTVLTKDEDELAAAVDAGRFSAADAERFAADAAAATAVARSGAPPFDGSWDDWTADPDWPVPALPAVLAALPPVVREPRDDDGTTHLQRLRAAAVAGTAARDR